MWKEEKKTYLWMVSFNCAPRMCDSRDMPPETVDGRHKTIDTRIPTSCNHTATYRLQQRRDKQAISSRYMDQHQ